MCETVEEWSKFMISEYSRLQTYANSIKRDMEVVEW